MEMNIISNGNRFPLNGNESGNMNTRMRGNEKKLFFRHTFNKDRVDVNGVNTVREGTVLRCLGLRPDSLYLMLDRPTG